MRIIAGTARGIRLATPPKSVRPTSDRVRESLFGSLGQFFEGGDVLDLYAGTGAMGIEALSRGCERCVFVDRDRRAVATIRENLQRTGFEGWAEVMREDVGRVLGRMEEGRRQFNLIFLDPPYRIAATEVRGVLSRLRGILAPGGRVVVERGEALDEESALEKGVTRRYGGTFVTIFERFELEHEGGGLSGEL